MKRRGSTANFSEHAEPRYGFSQVASKEAMDRSTFRRKHQGKLGRETEFAAQDTIDKQMLQDAEKQLKWLLLVEKKTQSQRGFVPRDYYSDLSDAYYHLDGIFVQINSNTEARRILAELIAAAQSRAMIREDLLVRKSHHEKDAWSSDSRLRAKRALLQFEKTGQIEKPELIELLRVYKNLMGQAALQEMLQEMRVNQKEAIIRLARDVGQYIVNMQNVNDGVRK